MTISARSIIIVKTSTYEILLSLSYSNIPEINFFTLSFSIYSKN